MVHGDDNGLILPPRIAPNHIVIIPIAHTKESESGVFSYCEKLSDELKDLCYHDSFIKVDIDKRVLRSGEKYWYWVKKGVPIIVEVGPREIEKSGVVAYKRTELPKCGEFQSKSNFV